MFRIAFLMALVMSLTSQACASNVKAILDPSKPPSENFDLEDWYISIPDDTDGNGLADNFKGSSFKGYTNDRYFYTGSDGGMVFKCPIAGYKTSKKASFTRVELREMLTRGTSNNSKALSNNWAFSTAPQTFLKQVGGVDGVLRATLAVNHVTETGKAKEMGRVIIGQIHAVKDEPLRLYYRKTPRNSKGTIYLAHEPERSTGRQEVYEIFYGENTTSGMKDPVDGIALNEKFTYEIRVEGHLLAVTIFREGRKPLTKTVDMASSGYDKIGQFMYFKAGVYNQNKTGEPDDYVQATFYELSNSHEGYTEF